MAEGEPKWQVVFVLGKPGSGKTTQAHLVAQKLDYQHLSTGELIKEQTRDDNSEFGAEILKYLNIAPLIPSEMTCAILKQAMERSDKQNFVIDGFPRSLENYEEWQNVIGHLVVVRKVIVINCSDQVCQERCLQIRQREDDSEARFLDRLKTFSELTHSILGMFRTLGLLTEVSGDRNKEEVLRDVLKVLSTECP